MFSTTSDIFIVHIHKLIGFLLHQINWFDEGVTKIESCLATTNLFFNGEILTRSKIVLCYLKVKCFWHKFQLQEMRKKIVKITRFIYFVFNVYP
jgi:hypothetical protein